MSALLLKLRKMKGCDEIITKYACKTLECLYAFLDTNKSNHVHEE